MASSPRMIILTVMLGFLCACGTNGPDTVTPEEAEAIAREAYVYGYPMVMNYKTLYNYVIDTSNPEYKGPFNEVSCEARLFTPDDKAMVTPNADTPYCIFWLDLRAEPQVLSVPEMEPERFYHVPAHRPVHPQLRLRGHFDHRQRGGHLPHRRPGLGRGGAGGRHEVLSSETDFVLIIDSHPALRPRRPGAGREIQAEYTLEPLSAFLGTDPPTAPPEPDYPEWDEGAQFDERFFAYLDLAMDLLGAPAPGREGLCGNNLAGLVSDRGDDFDFAALPSEIQEAMKTGREAGFADMEAFIARLLAGSRSPAARSSARARSSPRAR